MPSPRPVSPTLCYVITYALHLRWVGILASEHVDRPPNVISLAKKRVAFCFGPPPTARLSTSVGPRQTTLLGSPIWSRNWMNNANYDKAVAAAFP